MPERSRFFSQPIRSVDLKLRTAISFILPMLLMLVCNANAVTSGYTVPTLPEEAPADLDPLGRKLWQTLVMGRPQFSNWSDLMWGVNVSGLEDQHARDQYRKVLDEVERRLAPQKTEMKRQVSKILGAELADHPAIARIDSFEDPKAKFIRDLDSFARGRPSEKKLTWNEAESLARGKLNPAWSYPGERDRAAHLQALTIKQLALGNVIGDSQRTDELRAWLIEYEARLRSRVNTLEQILLAESCKDPETYPFLVFGSLIGSGEAIKFNFLSRSNPLDKTLEPVPETLFAEKYPEMMRAFYLRVGTSIDPDLVSDRFLSRRAQAFAIHPRLGPIVLKFFESRRLDDLDRYVFLNRYGSPHQKNRISRLALAPSLNSLLYRLTATWLALRQPIRQWEGDAQSFRSQVDLLFRNYSNFGIDVNASLANQQWYDHLDLKLYLVPKTETLANYQILSRGLSFWDDLSQSAAASSLPRLNTQLDQTRPAGRGLGLRVSEFYRGNERIIDPSAQTTAFTVSLLDSHPAQPEIFRLATRDSSKKATPFRPARCRANLKIEGGPIGRVDLLDQTLPIPSPRGYVPTARGSIIRVLRPDGSSTEYPLSREFLHDPSRGVFAVDLNFLRPGDSISKVSLSFAKAPPEARTSSRLAFDDRQIELIRKWAADVGASKFIDELRRASARTAREIALAIENASVYSTERREFDQLRPNYADFVNSEGRFEIQCTMAAAILKKVIAIALNDRLEEAGVELRSNVQFGSRPASDGRIELTMPLHETVDVYLYGVFSETLDATPSLPKIISDAAGPTQVGSNIAALAASLARDRATLVGALGERLLNRQPDESLPILPLLKRLDDLARAATSLAEDSSGPALEQFERLHTEIDALGAQVEAITRHRASNDADAADRGVGPTAKKMLSPAVTYPLLTLTQTGRELAASCRRFLSK